MKLSLNRLRYFFVALFLLEPFSSAFGWGPKGHEFVNKAAIGKAPRGSEGFPSFFKTQESNLWIIFMALEPDRWRESGEAELKAAESPNHFLDLELLKGVDPAADRMAAIERYAANGNKPWEVGYLPYVILETFEKLKISFRTYRSAKAAGLNTLSVERNVVYDAGLLGHYVADGSVPLHVTIKYNGWKGDNPNGYRTEKGLHDKFENEFVEKFVTLAPVQAIVTAPRVLDDPPRAVIDYLRKSFSLVEAIYQLEKRGELDHLSDSTKSFVVKRLAVGSQMLLDLWWTAWKKSAP